MHQGAAGGTHTYPTFFTSQLLGLLQEKENRCSRDFLTSQTQQLSGRSNHAFSGTSVVARASDRPPAGGSRERIGLRHVRLPLGSRREARRVWP